MKIKHNPNLDTDRVAQHYSERDGVPVTYVCTTDLKVSDCPVDIFYRETPHPKFGNRYFGLFSDPTTKGLMITNADMVEDFEFGCVENDEGELEYSESHHAYKSFENGNMIDGGRQYVRSAGRCFIYKVVNGEMVRHYG